ncbi:Aste57867_5468 [Aphanomyces stellatus]|uniref:Aste57867_5468 protein n=1 Tax=Aphanomyces stellatus TaxID=120398 RepID=A0A485KDG5_9STRA|nr:hypothetical protein As57867_005455 [Aphanomyces stellatus]VFT82520.1 Aste57867_5468 [Aphanomyces stellatus]
MDPASSHHTGREECMAWLNNLGVVDPWRIHHSQDRVFSSPKGKYRLDYILVDEPLMRASYHDASYFRSVDIKEHMCHMVTLQATPHTTERSYWQLPKELLAIPEVTNTIIAEAKGLLPVLRVSPNPGVKTWGRLFRELGNYE